MHRRLSALSLCGLAVLLLGMTLARPARAQVASTSSAPGTYVFFQRTSGHVTYGQPEVFQQVRSWVRLYVLVDRPVTKPLKLTVQCQDMAGQLVLEAEAAENAWRASTAAGRTLAKLEKELERRLGQPGLLRGDALQPLPQSAPVRELEGPPATIRLPAGTPVRLMLLETVSSKTARVGRTVRLQVLGDVKIGDLVVIANGSPASATIDVAKAARRAWRAGTLALTLSTVTLVHQQQQPLLGAVAANGVPTHAFDAWLAWVLDTRLLGILALPFAPLQHGNQAELHPGSVLDAQISGDVLLSRTAIEAAQPAPPEVRRGTPSVTFYIPSFANTAYQSVWCGRTKLGDLWRGGRFTLNLPPGTYWLGAKKNDRATALELEEGSETYVRVFAFANRRGLDVVPHDVGQVESAGTTEAESHSVADVSKLDLAKLATSPRTVK